MCDSLHVRVVAKQTDTPRVCSFELIAADGSQLPPLEAILFAGGIGITPILSMTDELTASNVPFELHYCARSQEQAPFIKRLMTSEFAARVHWYFSREKGERLEPSRVLDAPQSGSHIYVCGPTSLIDSVFAAARNARWPESQLHRERFSAQKPLASAENASDFKVQVASTGQVLDVPLHRTIVQVLRENGYAIVTSCEQGVCGTCLTRVLEGEPLHKDSYLMDEERDKNDRMLLCCSRARTTKLVLDL